VFGRYTLVSISVVYILLAVLITVDWCRQKGDESSSTRLVLAGSTSVQPFAEKLAEVYMEKRSGLEIPVQGGGSTAGIQAVRSKVADIGTCSRNLKGDERSLHKTVIARDAIAIIVHPDNPVRSLTLDQVRDIYAGKIRQWDEVGGRPESIVCVSREEGSGTLGAFRKLVMRNARQSLRSLVQDSNGAVRETVATSRRMIGFISMQLLWLDDRVKGEAVDGVLPTPENATSGRYKLVRPFLFVTDGPPKGIGAEFIEFVLGPEGQEILTDEGLVAVQ